MLHHRCNCSVLNLVMIFLFTTTAGLWANEEKHLFDMEAGEAVEQLKLVAYQADVELLFGTDIPAGVTTKAIHGYFTVEEALKRMLEGTPLAVVPVSDGKAFGIINRAEKGGNGPLGSDKNNQLYETKNIKSEMNAKKNNWFKTLTAIFAFGVAIEQSDLAGQQENEKENIFDLNPFTIEADNIEGYKATSTLAGTRLKTDLRDVASAVSIYTKQFLEDTGATNIQELLVYSTGTEVAGLGGNISNTAEAGSFATDFSPERFASNSTTRVRGLASADNTRNFFSTLIPLDSYNIDRVTINRGANNILFGLGSPAGIIDRSLSRPLSVDSQKLEFRVDKYGSARGIVDVNRSTMDGDLNFRIISLYDWREFRQNPAYDKSRKVYGAVDYFPSETTSFRVNFEFGDRDSSPEMLAPPRDKFTTWWAFGKPTRPNGENNGGSRYLDIVTNAAFSPVVFYEGGSTVAGSGVIALNNPGTVVEPGDSLYNVVAPEDRLNYQPRFVGLNDLNRYHTENYQFFGIGNPLALYSQSLQIRDTSIFDYNENSLTGRNDKRWNKFKAYNIILQQEFVPGVAGMEIAFDYQEFDNGSFNIGGGSWRSSNIGLDASEALPDGTANPNLGRPFFSSLPAWSESNDELDTKRATAYYKFDAEEKFGNIGKWIGAHTFTGLYDNSSKRTFSKGGPGIAYNRDFGNAIGFSDSQNKITSRLPSNLLMYLGDPLVDANTPVGASINRLPDHIILPEQATITYVNGSTRKFETNTFSTFRFPDDKDVLTTNANKSKFETESIALAWQGKWFADNLVSTLGWRQDSLKSSVAGPAPQNELGTRILDSNYFTFPNDSDIDTEDNTFSWGLVGHTPLFIRNKLPFGMDIDLHYSESENFAPTQIVGNPFGGFHEPPTGNTKDYGYTVSLLEQKVIARFNWYETLQKNLPDSRLASPYNWYFATIPQIVYEFNSVEDIEAAGGIPLPVQSIQDAYNYNFITNNDGSVSLEVQSMGATDLITAASKGFEFELTSNITPNWRLTLNAAKQNAVRTGTAQIAGEEFLRLYEAWVSNPAAMDLSQNGRSAISFRVNEFKDVFTGVLVTDGEKADELREWRVNLVNNYSFSPDSKLKGFSIGGAGRWQSSPVIGNEYYIDSELGYVPDINRPVLGPEDFLVDAWLSYKRPIWRNVEWSIKLNVRNVLNEDNLIPVYHNPDGTGRVYRLAKERDWFLTSTFSF